MCSIIKVDGPALLASRPTVTVATAAVTACHDMKQSHNPVFEMCMVHHAKR